MLRIVAACPRCIWVVNLPNTLLLFISFPRQCSGITFAVSGSNCIRQQNGKKTKMESTGSIICNAQLCCLSVALIVRACCLAVFIKYHCYVQCRCLRNVDLTALVFSCLRGIASIHRSTMCQPVSENVGNVRLHVEILLFLPLG